MKERTGKWGRQCGAILLAAMLLLGAGSVHAEAASGVRGFVQRLYQVILN